MKPSEIIDKALTEVMPDASRWIQRDLTDGHGFCLAGSIMQAAGTLAHPDYYSAEYQAYLRARNACRNIIFEITGEEITVPRYNDDKNRTYEDVRAVMEKARASLQEKGE